MTIYFLFHIRHKQDPEELLNDFTKFFKRITEKSAAYFRSYVGIGRIMETVENIHLSKRDADLCVQFLKTSNLEKNYYTYLDLGVHRLFLNQDYRDLQEYKEDKIGPVLAYDAKNGTELHRTLGAFLNSDRNLNRTAENLFVHINTVKYRLKQLKHLLASPPAGKVNWFEIQLALSIHDYLTSMSCIEQTNGR